MSLYLFDDGTIKGNYIFKDSADKILLAGETRSNAVLLTEYGTNASSGSFKGNVFTDTLDKFAGLYIDSSLANKSLQFHLKLSAINWGSYEHRYSDIYGRTEEIEAFVSRVKKEILSNNKAWVISHVSYPIRHVLKKAIPLSTTSNNS